MDIAEIRKKARSESERKTTQSAVEVSASSNVTVGTVHSSPETDVDALQPDSLSSDCAPPVISLDTITADPPATDVSHATGIEALFQWSPQSEELGANGYVTSLEHSGSLEVEQCRWLAFSLGDEEYALEIGCIREIIKPREITDIPRVPSFLLGIISLRGNIIPVFDLKNRLRLGVSDISSASRIVVCQDGERLAGLLVDSISQVVSLPAASIEPPPSVLIGIARDLVEGVGRVQGKMLILLQLSSVLDVDLS